MLAVKVDFNKRTYNNGYFVLENLKTLFAKSNCSAAISTNALNLKLTLPSDGQFVVDMYSSLWTGPNSWDYMILMNRINANTISRAMAPKVAGSWGFVNTRILASTKNGDQLAAYLNTNGNNFSDGNMSNTDSYMLAIVYRVG